VDTLLKNVFIIGAMVVVVGQIISLFGGSDDEK